MSIWKTFKRPLSKAGEETGMSYMKDGRLISNKSVPYIIMEEFKKGENDVDDFGMDLNAKPKICVFCGMGCKYSRMLNGEIVYLCDEHFYSKNLGQVAQKLRELNDESKVPEEASR